jgi:hypothetical protein
MLERIFVVLANIVRMRRNIVQMICWGHIWSSMNSWRIINIGINMGSKDLMKHRWGIHIWRGGVSTGVEEEQDDVNKADILGLTDDDTEF